MLFWCVSVNHIFSETNSFVAIDCRWDSIETTIASGSCHNLLGFDKRYLTVSIACCHGNIVDGLKR